MFSDGEYDGGSLSPLSSSFSFSCSPEYLSSLLSSDAHIYVQGHAATPTELLDALCAHSDASDSKYNLHHIILSGKCAWADPKYYGRWLWCDVDSVNICTLSLAIVSSCLEDNVKKHSTSRL